ncbi:uncharacterized protein [Montipora capricornis]|uniref:uncharacterized protein n=1 Tax=Montipora capricornis TaxID=246305 RepID=UPI0035F1BF09
MDEVYGKEAHLSSPRFDAAVDKIGNTKSLTTSEREKAVLLFVFGVFGFILQIFFSVGIAASQDILEDTYVPTPVLLISASLPFFVITSVLPYFVLQVPQHALLGTVVFLSIVGVLLYALVEHVVVRILGVVVTSTGIAIGEVTFVSLSALYADSAMSAYAAGTGFGFITGPLYYAAMTTMICVPPETTMLIISWTPLVMLACYAVMEKRHYASEKKATCTHENVAYFSLLEENVPEKANPSSWTQKRALIMNNLHLALSFFLGYFSEFLTINGVVTTLAFSDSPFDPRSHFVYYACVFMIGECIGRSYITFLGFIHRTFTPVVTRTWIFSAILFALLIFLTLSSVYRFIHTVWIVLLLCFLVGLLAGSLYVNTYLVASVRDTDDANGKAFSRAFLSVGPSAGVLVAGVVGLALEPALRNHCLETTQYSEFCFTRSMNGWNKTTSCLR